MKARTGFLGPRGTWTEEAAMSFSDSLELIPYSNICNIVDDVDSGRLTYGVIPVENSIGGGVVDTLDCLANSRDALIISEKIMNINHVLMSSGELEQIEVVISHQNAIAQCRKTIANRLPAARVDFSSSTAEAGRIASTDSSVGVVGSRRIAELYDLRIQSERMSDLKDNYTRFVMIGKEFSGRTGKDRTSICVTLKKNEYASLWRFLGIFAALKINLSRIESRPDPVSPGEYKFFFDMFGHRDDMEVSIALNAIKTYCSTVSILGSYPREEWPRA
ncbi:hypothetical protein IX51_08830 [uncultured archaeon]|nr:hypothetical protein IX51_08830 [uncultured archaeon]